MSQLPGWIASSASIVEEGDFETAQPWFSGRTASVSATVNINLAVKWAVIFKHKNRNFGRRKWALFSQHIHCYLPRSDGCPAHAVSTVTGPDGEVAVFGDVELSFRTAGIVRINRNRSATVIRE